MKFRSSHIEIALVIGLLALGLACQGSERTTTVRFSFSDQDGKHNKVLTKADDINGAFVVVFTNDFGKLVFPIDPTAASVTLAVPNGDQRIFRVIFYVEKLFNSPTQPFPITSMPAGAYFSGESEPIDLSGDPVTVSIVLVESTNLVGMRAQVELVNNQSAGDTIDYFGPQIRVRDLETNFEYPPMLINKTGGVIYPPILVPGHGYFVHTVVGPQPFEETVVIPAAATSDLVLNPFQLGFTPLSASDPNSLENAINTANSSPGLDVIDIAGGGPDYSLTAELPALTDPAGTVLRGMGGSAIIDGILLSALEIGLRLASSHNLIKNLEIKNFPNFGIAINAPSTTVASFNLIEDTVVRLNKMGGIELIDAEFSRLGPNLAILDNDKFGVRLNGDSKNFFLHDSTIKCKLTMIGTDPKTTGVTILGNSSAIHIGDGAVGLGGVSNIINNCTFGIELRNQSSAIEIAGNTFGNDPNSGFADEPNRVGIYVDNQGSGGSRIFFNQFHCNGSVLPNAPACIPPASLFPPNLPPAISADGAVALSANAQPSEIRRNLFAHNSRGIHFTSGSLVGHWVDHNSIFGNLTGITFDSNSGSMDVTNNIISHNSSSVGNSGLRFVDNTATVGFYASNLLYNYNGANDQDCVSPSNPGYCSATIEATSNATPDSNGNINCDPIDPDPTICNPDFNQIATKPFDFHLNASSPAIDQGGPDSGDPINQPVNGSTTDIGAFEF